MEIKVILLLLLLLLLFVAGCVNSIWNMLAKRSADKGEITSQLKSSL